MGLLELPDLRHTLVDIGTTLLCISGYNGLPGRTLPINLIHETARRSERVDNAALSSAVSYEISGQIMVHKKYHKLPPNWKLSLIGCFKMFIASSKLRTDSSPQCRTLSHNLVQVHFFAIEKHTSQNHLFRTVDKQHDQTTTTTTSLFQYSLQSLCPHLAKAIPGRYKRKKKIL